MLALEGLGLQLYFCLVRSACPPPAQSVRPRVLHGSWSAISDTAGHYDQKSSLFFLREKKNPGMEGLDSRQGTVSAERCVEEASAF